MANPLLEVNNLSVSYGDVRALWDVSFSVEEGSIVALVGLNGAGKSTLLNAISGLLTPLRGEILFEGEDMASLSASKRVDRGILQVPEGRLLFQSLTIKRTFSGAYLPKARSGIVLPWNGLQPVPCARDRQDSKRVY